MSAPLRSCRYLLVLLWAVGTPAAGSDPTIHFRPVGHALGDVHPYLAGQECFLFYLKPGIYESALARSTDGLHWTETPLEHEAVGPEDWFSPYFVLGVFRDEPSGLYLSYYGHKDGRIAGSISRNLLHWACTPREFCIPPSDYYQRRRDPFVFRIAETGTYGCVMTTWIKGETRDRGGAVSLATSPDLRNWKDHGPILYPGDMGEPECPQMFRLGGKWRLLASVYDRAVGRPLCWTGASVTGPWTPAAALDGKDLCAAQVAMDGETPILFGWIPLLPAQPGSQHWGGHLALPRQVHITPDGSLGTRLWEKCRAAFAQLTWQHLPDLDGPGGLRGPDGGWERLALEFRLQLPAQTDQLRLRCDPLGEVVLGRSELAIRDTAGTVWSTLAVRLPDDADIPVELFIEEDIVELFVNERYSLVARLPAAAGPLQVSVLATPSVPRPRLTAVRAAQWRLPVAGSPTPAGQQGR